MCAGMERARREEGLVRGAGRQSLEYRGGVRVCCDREGDEEGGYWGRLRPHTFKAHACHLGALLTVLSAAHCSHPSPHTLGGGNPKLPDTAHQPPQITVQQPAPLPTPRLCAPHTAPPSPNTAHNSPQLLPTHNTRLNQRTTPSPTITTHNTRLNQRTTPSPQLLHTTHA